MTNRSCLTATVETEEPIRFTGPTAGVQRERSLEAVKRLGCFRPEAVSHKLVI